MPAGRKSSRRGLGVIAVGVLATIAGGAAVGGARPPAQTPPAPSGPLVEFARVEPAAPTAGARASLLVRVRDPVLPIRGMRVDLNEPGGRRGGSACQTGAADPGSPFKPGAAVTMRVRFRFKTAGQRKVRFTVTSGDCSGSGLRFNGEVAVVVAPAPPKLPVASFAQGALCSHADTPTTQTAVQTIRAATMCLINAERRRRKAPMLRRSGRLERAASAHASDMVKRRFFEHEGPNGPTFPRRLGRVRYKGGAGENIGYETGPEVTPRSIFRGWMESPGHKANMLRKKYRGAGVGVAKSAPVKPPETGATFTANFGTVAG